MPDVRLQDPNSDFVAVTGSPIEAAQLRARGYTDVNDDDKPSGASSNAPGAPSGNTEQSVGGTSTPTGTDGNTGDPQTGDAQAAGSKPATGKGASARR
jgi:hypothetical protein